MVQVVGSIGRSGVVRGRVAYQGVKSTSHGGRGRATMMRGRRGVVSVGVMTPDFVSPRLRRRLRLRRAGVRV